MGLSQTEKNCPVNARGAGLPHLTTTIPLAVSWRCLVLQQALSIIFVINCITCLSTFISSFLSEQLTELNEILWLLCKYLQSGQTNTPVKSCHYFCYHQQK